jgi:hypothetical protein
VKLLVDKSQEIHKVNHGPVQMVCGETVGQGTVLVKETLFYGYWNKRLCFKRH